MVEKDGSIHSEDVFCSYSDATSVVHAMTTDLENLGSPASPQHPVVGRAWFSSIELICAPPNVVPHCTDNGLLCLRSTGAIAETLTLCPIYS